MTWELLDELAGAATIVFSLVWMATHLNVYLQPTNLPLWLMTIVVLIGFKMGLWAWDRTFRLCKRIWLAFAV